MNATFDQLAGSSERLIFGRKIFRPRQPYRAASDKGAIVQIEP
jgi:hypothetical protein